LSLNELANEETIFCLAMPRPGRAPPVIRIDPGVPCMAKINSFTQQRWCLPADMQMRKSQWCQSYL